MKNKFWIVIIITIILGCVVVLGSKDNESEETIYYELTETSLVTSYSVTEEVTNYVEMVINEEYIVLIELYEDTAPITVANFKKLVYENYYDGLVFHRIIEDFVVQGGDGETTDYITGEFEINGIENDISHTTGVISMARASSYDSASSQFFICLNDESCLSLDGYYAAFGKVIDGMDIITQVSLVDTDESDYPLEVVEITSINFINIEE